MVESHPIKHDIRPLRGVRVVDLTVAWAGPMAGRILAYLGAEVIHVEGPNRVDSWRDPLRGGYPERYPDLEYGAKPYNRSFKFNSQNIGKRAVSVDLKQDAGRDILKDLVRQSDVLLTNFRPGTLRRLGLGPADLEKLNSRLVVVEMPAFGLDGPRSQEAGYGPTMEAASGMAAMVGYGDGRPYNTGPAYLDPTGAFNGAAAVLTGLVARDKSNTGIHLELAQCEAAMHAVGELILESFDRDRSPLAEGNSVVDAEPHEAFQCAGTEQWIVIGVRDDTEWQALCAALPAPSLACDDRFIDALGRRRNRAALYAALSAATRGWVKEDLAKRLQAAGVIAAPVCDGGDAARRPDLWSAGFYQLLDHPSAGARWYQGLPLRFGEDLLEADRAAPEFGQDNAYVAGQLLGRSAAEFDRLVADAVMTPEPAGLDRPRRGDEVLE